MSEMVERFERFFDRGAPNECWNWHGSLTGNRCGMKYGQFSMNGKMVRAHRVAYQIAYGVDPRELVVMHKCDNPRCVNPQHLMLGTQADNVLDRDRKGRANPLLGVRHQNAKLTNEQVMKMRQLKAAGVPIRRIGGLFNVSSYAVMHATKYGWKHL